MISPNVQTCRKYYEETFIWKAKGRQFEQTIRAKRYRVISHLDRMLLWVVLQLPDYDNSAFGFVPCLS